MRKENYMCLFFAGVAALFFTAHSVASAADTVVVIPLFTTATCTAPDEVRSAGYCWKDRNLGASQVAITFDDADAYGDLYQWGRLRDGHQHPTSLPVAVQSVNDDPEHGNFITHFFNWITPSNNNLWQGLGGVNNPCPQGFRLPTELELDSERQSWDSNDAEGAFTSPLKLVAACFRNNIGTVILCNFGYYWSSTVVGDVGDLARYLLFSNTNTDATMGYYYRVNGFSVRCIKD